MDDKKRTLEIIERLEKLYPNAYYYLNFKSPLELLVAVILSAQAKDETVNTTTPKLFARYRQAKDYADASLKEIQSLISNITFPRAKAAYIKKACQILVARFGAEVPQTFQELTQLPGIGRKSANVILINGFNKTLGIAVDTHVIRLAQRLGLSKNKNPEKIEQDLMKVIPKTYWAKITWLLKSHGRALCKAPLPLCPKCKLSYICKGVNPATSFQAIPPEGHRARS